MNGLAKTHSLGMLRSLRHPFIVIAAFFLFIHPFVLKSASALSYAFVYGVPLFYILLHLRELRVLFSGLLSKGKGLRRTAAFFAFVILVLASAAFHETGDYSYFDVILSVVRTVLRLSFLALLVLRMRKPGADGFILFISLYAMASVVYVGFSVILIVFPSFKEFWFSLITQDALYKTQEENYVSRIGINGFAGFRETFSCSLGFAFSLYLTEAGYYDKKYPRYLMALMCFMGNFLYGRIGLVVSALVFALYVVWYKKYMLIMLLPILGLLALGLVQVLISINPSFSASFTWATTPFIEFFTTGATENYSLNRALFGMRFMPETQVVLFGSGYYTDPDTGGYYMGTDLGYLRLLLYAGISGLIIVYYLVVSTAKELSSKSWFLFFSVLLIFIPFEYKGEIWYSLLPLLIIAWLMIESGKNGTVNSQQNERAELA